MPIYRGNRKLKDLFKGSKIGTVYHGSTLVFNDLSSKRFNPSGSIQTYVVPGGVKKVRVTCVASRGYQKSANGSGYGGKVECDLAVNAKQKLYIVVGATPTEQITAIYNASDIRLNNAGILDTNSLKSRLVVAGGGGGQANSGAKGGNGGGTTGGTGGKGYRGDSGGIGGNQSSGGKGGAGQPVSVGHYHNGNNGGFPLGGNAAGCNGRYEGMSGAGGAGYYGGGSGAADWNKNGAYTAGGGGGSSYTHPSQCSNVKHTQGANNGSGYIIITPIL